MTQVVAFADGISITRSPSSVSCDSARWQVHGSRLVVDEVSSSSPHPAPRLATSAVATSSRDTGPLCPLWGDANEEPSREIGASSRASCTLSAGSPALSAETRPGLGFAQRHEVLRALRREGHDEEGRIFSPQGACLNQCRHNLVGRRIVSPVRVEAQTRGSREDCHGLIIIIDRERCCGLERKCRGRRGRIVIATTGGKKDRQRNREHQPQAGHPRPTGQCPGRRTAGGGRRRGRRHRPQRLTIPTNVGGKPQAPRASARHKVAPACGGHRLRGVPTPWAEGRPPKGSTQTSLATAGGPTRFGAEKRWASPRRGSSSPRTAPSSTPVRRGRAASHPAVMGRTTSA